MQGAVSEAGLRCIGLGDLTSRFVNAELLVINRFTM